MFFNNSFYIVSHGAAINFLIWTSSLFFFFRHFYLSTRFLCFNDWIFCQHSLTNWPNLFLSLSLFLVLFWIIWMLVTVHKPCHVPHASQITNWRTIFKERLFLVSKEWDRSWSRAFLIAYHKTFIKKFLAVRPEKVTRRKKTKKKLERQL